MTLEPLDTAEGAEHVGCQQLNIFLENRVGQLLRIVRMLEAEPIRIVGMSVEGKVDCAILRLLVDKPDDAARSCADGGFAASQSDVLVVELPKGKRGIMTVCAALISAEVNVNYAYTAWATDTSAPCLVISVDSLPQAASVLAEKGFRMLDQEEL